MRGISRSLPALLLATAALLPARAAEPPRNAPPLPHGFFSSLTRIFARFDAVDPTGGAITLLPEGERDPRALKLRPDTDVFLNELPAEATELTAGSRIWVAMEGSPAKPGPVRFIADEPTYQALHGTWYTVESVDAGSRAVTLAATEEGREQRVSLAAAGDFELLAGRRRRGLADVAPGMQVRFQSRFREGRRELARAVSHLAWELNRVRQAAALDASLAASGLPGELQSVDDGACTLLIYRAGSDWARRLRAGDRVAVRLAGSGGSPDPPAAVAGTAPWGEKTRVTLRLRPPDAAAGTPLRLRMPRPAKRDLPPGLGIATDPEERVEWFMSVVFCTCGVRGDRCTGHLYTLSMCNQKDCAKPEEMKTLLRDRIRQGLTDAQILERLRLDEGPRLLVPHLLQ